MLTISILIKVKFRHAEVIRPSNASAFCGDRRIRNGFNIREFAPFSMSSEKRSRSVLNVKLEKSNNSKLRRKQRQEHNNEHYPFKPVKPDFNNIKNTQNESTAKNLMNTCQFTDFAYYKMLLTIIVTLLLIGSVQSILIDEQDEGKNTTNYRITTNSTVGRSSVASPSGYLDKLDNLERSVAAVLIKVAYGTTSTTKRSIPDNSYILGLTTVATPLLTTLRYHSANQPPHSGARHRNYELDLERDHALPTSAPNADILKSNNNPTYPNPNRHHSSSNSGIYDRERHRHTVQHNSTPMPSIPNLMKKANGQPTIPMYPGDIPSYSPPSRSFFTPPLPPEYQNPFADKPTLRGTNNEGLVSNVVPFNNRRPIPPPSLMPGHERIPFRPPDLVHTIGNSEANESTIVAETKKPLLATSREQSVFDERKKALNTPSRNGNEAGSSDAKERSNNSYNKQLESDSNGNKRQEVIPNIRRILGTNGKKGDIPAVLLRQVTQRPTLSHRQPPASPVVAVDNVESSSSSNTVDNAAEAASSASSNINKSKQIPGQLDGNVSDVAGRDTATVTTPSAAAAIGEAAVTSFTSTTVTATNAKPVHKGKADHSTGASLNDAMGSGSAAAAASAHTTWTWAWNIHIYLSVVLFTILAVYSLYKLVTYNKLTHLFAQSYFVYIQLILIGICIMRIIYLCIDAYNIHATFPIFAAELLLNLPSTFLTVAFAVLILFLFLKSLNHKNNRYSALVRPLTVVVGCGVHVLLCITLHYVESYTLQNHHMYYQQQQQQQYLRRQQLQQQQHPHLIQQAPSTFPSSSLANPPPPRVLSLICQIIYIFICLSLGLLYLYLYRILKRILRSKSQNYIHGYQNLSYAIHITIATALLFVLLATLQIFGAVCISAVRPLMSQANVIEIDWLQWGYQFSMRLIEIAIVTLISWVTGLKMTSIGSNGNAANVAINGDIRMGGSAVGSNINGSVMREKHPATPSANHHNSHANVANFFLPCTSSSSQEQFETDYPAICNANTNLHTYTMRTGKLIYDDSYALNSLTAGPSAATPSGNTEYQLQEPMYQRPYDTGSIRSAINHNITTDYGSQTSRYQQHQHYHHTHNLQHAHSVRAQDTTAYMSADYMTDATTDHYENPNFDLRTSSTGGIDVGIGVVGTVPLQKIGKNSGSSGSAPASGSGSGSASGSSQQQMLLLQSDSCYSEPLQENSSYEFNNFERPVFKENSNGEESWPERDRDREIHKMPKSRERKQKNNILHDATNFEHAERRSSNSTNSCSSSNGIRYASYNSYDRGGNYNGVRKSGTLNSIVNGPAGGSGPPSGRAISLMPGNKRGNGAQTLAHNERSHYLQRSGRNMNTISNHRAVAPNDFELATSVCNELVALKQEQINQQRQLQRQQQYNHSNSDEDADEEEQEEADADAEEEEEDDILSGNNVESANLISNNEHGYCIANENSIGAVTNKGTPHLHVQSNPKSTAAIHQHHQASAGSCFAELDTSAAAVGRATLTSASDSMIVAEQGYLRFRRAQEELTGASTGGGEGNVKVHGKPTHGAQKPPNCSVSQICTNVNGIDC